MHCLSVRQPWASLIVRGIKDIENRTWCTNHRGPLLIHAAKRIDLDADTRGLLSRAEVEALPRGGIIGMVNVVACVTASSSPWFTGPVGWVLTDPRVLTFQRCTGRLGLFKVTPQQAAVRAILARHRLPLF
jgi:hypothetical protein